MQPNNFFKKESKTIYLFEEFSLPFWKIRQNLCCKRDRHCGWSALLISLSFLAGRISALFRPCYPSPHSYMLPSDTSDAPRVLPWRTKVSSMVETIQETCLFTHSILCKIWLWCLELWQPLCDRKVNWSLKSKPDLLRIQSRETEILLELTNSRATQHFLLCERVSLNYQLYWGRSLCFLKLETFWYLQK